MEHIEKMSAEVRGRVAEYYASEPAAPSDLLERFRSYFGDEIGKDSAAARGVGIAVWWNVTGPAGGDWTIDFRRDSDWVREGICDDWSLRISIPDKLVYLGVSEQAIWEHLVLSFRVRLARRPDRYMVDFWTWFCRR